jgi:hypothetical protein
MCTFITMIAASDDLEQINAILSTLDRRGYARRAERIDTPGLGAVLLADEREYWLTRTPCDCGTYLGHAVQPVANSDHELAADTARYRRKGWSEARIARAVADKERAAVRPARRQPNEDAKYWIDLMTALGAGLGLQRVGLRQHFHTKSSGEEPEIAPRQEAGNMAEAAEVLARMADGVVHDFTIKAP